jgi:arginine decarboxylase
VARWSIRDSLDLYNVKDWGGEFFNINGRGHMEVTPSGPEHGGIDIKELVDDLQRRGLALPMLIRFSDILRGRLAKLCGSFENAIREYDYKSRYLPVMPIKVNQQRHVMTELLDYGRRFNLGLEAGSKPELLVALALVDDPDAIIVCNGYKDLEYIETALLAQKLGRTPFIVIDRFDELKTIIDVAKKYGVRPHIGVRGRLSARGAGRWSESSGDRSKFGLTAAEIVKVVDQLRDEQMLDALQMLHFHIGSQISAIRAVKDALAEATRILTELSRMGASLRYLDVGGGLAVDYDGSRTNFRSSKNYSLQEYANDIVSAVGEACDRAGVPHPVIVSESGRALVAYHSVLVFNVLGASAVATEGIPRPPEESEHKIVHDLYDAYHSITRKSYQEVYHDILQIKEDAASLFVHGILDLRARARVEELYWSCNERILRIVRDLEYVPDDLEGLARQLTDTYYCNFSVFQSLPDHWAVKHLFPVMPLHRLEEHPSRHAVLADLTCDSDGKIDQFIDLHDVKNALQLHPPGDTPYYIGIFLVGAYQETLGDLHNLFGDTNAVHVCFDPEADAYYRLSNVVEGDTVAEVLQYVQYDRADLLGRVRNAAELALRERRISMEESALLFKRYESQLAGYTYLEGDEDGLPQLPAVAVTAAAMPEPAPMTANVVNLRG